MSKPIIFSIRVPVETRRTARGVLANCDFLELSREGRSTDEALNALTDSLKGYFEACFERGRFDRLFRSSGYCAGNDGPPAHGGRFIDVPLTLSSPHAMLSKTDIAGGIRSALERCAA